MEYANLGLRRALPAAALLVAALMASGSSGAVEFTVLHSFTGGAKDGATPQAALVADASGALYGTTTAGGPNNDGTVFRLSPPVSGHTVWGEAILHSFTGGSDSGNPTGGLVFDASGNLFGMTTGYCYISFSGDYGSLFELLAQTGGKTAWTYKLLYRLNDGSERCPTYSAPALDEAGAVYDGGFGDAFRISPPAAGQHAWHHEDLAYIGLLYGGVAFDSAGTLYGTAFELDNSTEQSFGGVYQLLPPAAGQTAVIAHAPGGSVANGSFFAPLVWVYGGIGSGRPCRVKRMASMARMDRRRPVSTAERRSA